MLIVALHSGEAAQRKAGKVVIRNYANCRLYDTSGSRYVNQEDIAALIRNGTEVQGIDTKTGQDLIRFTLIRIIVEDTKDSPAACRCNCFANSSVPPAESLRGTFATGRDERPGAGGIASEPKRARGEKSPLLLVQGEVLRRAANHCNCFANSSSTRHGTAGVHENGVSPAPSLLDEEFERPIGGGMTASSRTVGDHVRAKMMAARKQVQYGAALGFPSVLLIYNNIDPWHMFGTEDTALFTPCTANTRCASAGICQRLLILFTEKMRGYSLNLTPHLAQLGGSPGAGQMTVTLCENAYGAQVAV